MSVSAKSLGIDQLGIEDRLALVEEIWDSIAVDEPHLPLTEAQQKEIDRRIADHEADPNDVFSLGEVEASVSDRLKK